MRNEKLIHALGNCINHCNYCADACLDEENVKMMVTCIRTDRACAEVCSTLNQLLATGFKEVDDLVRYCAKICNYVQMNVQNTICNIVKIAQRLAENVPRNAMLI